MKDFISISNYSTVSQGRKRLRQKLEGDKELEALIGRIEVKLSTINFYSPRK